ncbi:MAG: FTR1 family iron permease [Rhodospirillales bacterium]|nr:MAG: FTR1 family iron permease [Rhodospirillales bacterium]
MSGQLWQVGFVVWRESVEALLIIAILDAWLVHAQEARSIGHGRRFIGLGVVAGLVLAVLLGSAFLALGEVLPEEGQDIFNTVMVFAAAGLIVQMIFWMRANARNLKSHLESTARRTVERAGLWGVSVLVAVAVAREGAETAVFLYGILGAAGSEAWKAVLAGLAGFALALCTYALIRLGGRRLSWKHFFGATEVMLLFLVAALVMSGFDHLISLGLIPAPGGALWDSSFLIDDATIWGGLIASLTGYRARPDLVSLTVYILYWMLMLLALRSSGTSPARRASA